MDNRRAGVAESKEALLTVFPACTLCGAPLFGSVAYTDLQKRAQACLQELVERSEHRAFLVGMPLQIQDKGLCNAIVFVQNCAIRGIITKKYLAPDEQKYFVRGEGVQVIQYPGPADSHRVLRGPEGAVEVALGAARHGGLLRLQCV